jgi:hypothetical protein
MLRFRPQWTIANHHESQALSGYLISLYKVEECAHQRRLILDRLHAPDGTDNHFSFLD